MSLWTRRRRIVGLGSRGLSFDSRTGNHLLVFMKTDIAVVRRLVVSTCIGLRVWRKVKNSAQSKISVYMGNYTVLDLW